MAVNYKELGLVNTREMFKRAVKGGYAIPAFNFNNLEQLQAIITAASETKSPVILQVSKGARAYANPILLRYMAEGAVEYAKSLGCNHPEIVLHLDHGDSFELVKGCVDLGFSSVMIDGSSLPYEENIELTKKCVEYAHQFDVTVEAELGVLAGVEDEVSSEESHYTRPEEVIDFSTRTGCDSLAISIGTSHGAYKFKPEQCTRDPKTGRLVPPPLAFDILHEIEEKLPGFPIVLHGSSSVPEEYVKIIDEYGGNLPNAVGIPEEQLREASKSAVCKINIDSDSRLAYTAGVRETLAQHPDYFDPRQYGKVARKYMTEMYSHKIIDVLGSDHKLINCD
ncbi:MAG: class II fructose-1,6-bisphosphate aldolase [Prevotella sp.]|nr:class II fructose-1,6-bisphosphate aldolase [Prevotella sp.]